MKNNIKISLIIISQIALIIGSFLISATLQSQNSLLGNSVNIAGKNRFLASQFIDEVKDFEYLKTPGSNPEEKLKQIEDNLQLLKNGGVFNEIQINKIESKFEDDWYKINENLTGLKTKYLEFKSKSDNDRSYIDLIPLEVELILFISNSDTLVEKLGSDIEKRSDDLVFLQIILLLINVGVHIILIVIIIGIYKSEFKRNLKLEKFAVIGELSSRLAHDMRNPISNINMSLELLNPKLNDKTTREKFDIIEKSAKRLSHQIEDVMDFVRTREPNISLWKLNYILQECLKRLTIPDSIKITLPEKNILIKCDKELFEILFINIIKNSLDSIDKEGSIKISSEESSKEIVIYIEDSGSGFSEEYVEQIFDPLFTLKEKGTGLGLSSCKNIIEIHGGKITAKNNPTTFTIILPKIKKQ